MNFLLALGIFVVSTGIDIYAARIGLPGFGLHIGVGFVMGAVLLQVQRHRLKLSMDMTMSAVVAFFAFLGLSLLSAFGAQDIPLGLMSLSRYALLFFTAYLLVSVLHARPQLRGLYSNSLMAGLCITAATVVIDAFYPGTFSAVRSRAAGIYLNANGASQAMMLMMLGILLLERGRKIDRRVVIAFGIYCIASFLTLSRGGILLSIIISCLFLVSKFPREHRKYLPVALAGLLFLGGFVLDQLLDASIFQNRTTAGRLERLFQIGSYVDVRDERYQLLWEYLSSDNPIIGHGPGSSAIWTELGGAAHNTFAKLYWESGIFAAAIYVILLIWPLFIAISFEVIFGVLALILLSFLTNYNMDNRLFYLVLLLLYAEAYQRRQGFRPLAPKRV